MSSRTWKQVAGQCLVAAAFAPICIGWPRDSYWMIVPALLHGCLVSAWLLRAQLQKMLAPLKTFHAL